MNNTATIVIPERKKEDDFTIERERDHFEVRYKGVFFSSEDTYKEAEDTIYEACHGTIWV